MGIDLENNAGSTLIIFTFNLILLDVREDFHGAIGRSMLVFLSIQKLDPVK